METHSAREVVWKIPCPSHDNEHFVDVYKEDGKYYVLCFGIDIEPYELTERELKYWNVPTKTSSKT